MASYTTRELELVCRLNSSTRKNRKMLLVEGKYDHKFFSALMKQYGKDLYDVFGLDRDSDKSNKEDLISFVNKDSNHNAIGYVDSDFDYAIDAVQNDVEKIRPYGDRILDTESSTDLNMMIISKTSLVNYLNMNKIGDAHTLQIIEVCRTIGVVRFFKRYHERKNPEKILHLIFSEMHNDLRKNPSKCTPKYVLSVLKERSRMNQANSFFFDKVCEDKINKTLKRFDKEGLENYSFVNGHDLTKVMKSISGIAKSETKIERDLLKMGMENKNLCQEIYSKLTSLS